MLGRRSLITCLGGLTACTLTRDSPPALTSRLRLSNAVEPAGDAELEASLQSLVSDDPFAPIGAVLRKLDRGEKARALVMILGDSHSAGPVLSERLRELFQGRFGGIGPGRFAPGRAQRFFNPSAMTLRQEGDWVARNALRATPSGPFGLTGYRLTGQRSGDWISLRSNDPEGFDRFWITLAFGPEGGSFRFHLDGWEGETASTREGTPRLHAFRMGVPPRSREIRIELAGDGPVEILSWGVDRRGRGVLVEAFGINGATVNTLDYRDASLLARELAVAPPALLVLEYGTNEATDRDLDPAAYNATLTRHVQRLKGILPRTGILLMGVPDAARPGRRRGSACGGALAPLPSLAVVREAQRKVARVERIGHFDWAAEVTGGLCRLPLLASGGPAALMRPDLVHFTPDGYRLTAERLYAHILRGAGLERHPPPA